MQPTLLNLRLRVEHEIGTHQHGQGEYFGVVVSVAFGGIEPFSVEEEDAHVLVLVDDGHTPKPDALGARADGRVHLELR